MNNRCINLISVLTVLLLGGCVPEGYVGYPNAILVCGGSVHEAPVKAVVVDKQRGAKAGVYPALVDSKNKCGAPDNIREWHRSETELIHASEALDRKEHCLIASFDPPRFLVVKIQDMKGTASIPGELIGSGDIETDVQAIISISGAGANAVVKRFEFDGSVQEAFGYLIKPDK